MLSLGGSNVGVQLLFIFSVFSNDHASFLTRKDKLLEHELQQ